MIVSLEGLPGAGKSTTAGLLPEYGPIEYLHERSSEHPFLAAFYSDVERYKFETELVFVLLHYHQYRDIAPGRDVVLDYSPVKDLIFADVNLTGQDYDIFTAVYQRTLGALPAPDLTIFFDLEPDHTLQRIAARDRDYERDIEPGYLQTIKAAYEARYAELGTRVQRIHVAADATRDDVVAAAAQIIWPADTRIHAIR